MYSGSNTRNKILGKPVGMRIIASETIWETSNDGFPYNVVSRIAFWIHHSECFYNSNLSSKNSTSILFGDMHNHPFEFHSIAELKIVDFSALVISLLGVSLEPLKLSR